MVYGMDMDSFLNVDGDGCYLKMTVSQFRPSVL
jgi:hypothetical protein